MIFPVVILMFFYGLFGLCVWLLIAIGAETRDERRRNRTWLALVETTLLWPFLLMYWWRNQE